jgi:flagellar protein FlbD
MIARSARNGPDWLPPDTVLTLVDGTKYVVAESIREVADRLVMNQAYALAIAYDLVEGRDRGQAALRALP